MYEIKIIESGFFLADGGAMFGAIPKRAWSRKYRSINDNLCEMAMRCLFVISDTKKILIDLGMGNKHLKQVEYYKPYNLADIGEVLNNYGYTLSDITDVIITHLHFDHCGYATVADLNGQAVPSFPNAKYWLSTKQWDVFQHPNRLERDSIFADNLQPVVDAGLLRLIDKDTLLDEGINIYLYDGHTNGQLVVCIQTNGGIISFPGDLIPTSAHVSLDWISAYDLCAITSVGEKERFLKKAVENNYTLIYYHDAYVIQSKVKCLNDNYKAIEQVYIKAKE